MGAGAKEEGELQAAVAASKSTGMVQYQLVSTLF